ncbi:MAG TPA: CHASE3 domain-containing protein [Bacteroidales bacterium]|jgi:PAS domain S-box-containing protein|nr:CHASE3 domain-containing protein [Bacteroidales bacterium]
MKFLKHNLTSLILVTVLAISIFMLLMAASISYRQISTLRHSQESVIRSYRIYVELEQLNNYVSDAETGQRGFLLTGDSIFLYPYFDALQRIKWSFKSLHQLTSTDAGQVRSLDTLIILINQRVKWLGMILGSGRYTADTPDTLRKLLLKGRDMMSVSLRQIDKMVYTELQVLKERENDRQYEMKISPFSLLFVVVFSIIVFITAYYKINKDLKGLARSNNQLVINNKIFEHSEQIANISHWYWNLRENKMTYSLNLYRLLGCKPKEFEPTFENFLQFVHPSDRHLLIENKKKAMKEFTPSMTFYRIQRRDGEIRHFKSTSKLITDNFGTTFSIGIHADITEQHKKDTLIGEKLADLEKSNKQLSAFSHIASHDLQEPLRKIQIFISRIKESDMKLIPDHVKDYISGIRKETVRMQKFITDLLLYSRASKADKTFEVSDLNEILENSKKELSHRIEERNAVINSTSDLPTLNVIPFQIQQLFSNLISNSIKYSRKDTNPVIDITTEKVIGKEIPGYNGDPDNRFHRISFSDNGIGFDQQYAEKIFTLFYRLHSNKEYTGTGIGLAICRLIAENHRGYISAHGNPDRGAIFYIYLPFR